MENENNQFNEYTEKHSAAYIAFTKEFEAENPEPERGNPDYSDWFVPVGLLVMVVASIIVSGSRTIEEFGGGIVGWSAFIMVEIAIIAFAFYITRMNVNIDRVEYTRRMAWAGVILAFLVAIAANLADVLRKHGVYVSPEFATILNGFVAISAPTLAFISGHILAVEYLKMSQRWKEIEKRFEEAKAAYKEAKHKTWQARKRQWGIRIQAEPVQAINPLNLIKNNRERPSKKLQIALDWLAAHPEHINTESRELVNDVGVSYGTIWKAQQIMKGGKYDNGHADGNVVQ
jgi:hypothetical protein